MQPTDTEEEAYPQKTKGEREFDLEKNDAVENEISKGDVTPSSEEADNNASEDLDVELGEDGHQLIVELIADIKLMYEFARRSGKQLSDELEKNIAMLLSPAPREQKHADEAGPER